MINVTQLISILKQTLSFDGKNIALHEPYFSGNEWKYVKECLDTGWVSSVGKFVDRFEQDLSDFTKVDAAVVTVNGTAALHIAFLLAGVTANDEVLVPTLTFVATTNAITYCRAIPHFIDSDFSTLGINHRLLADYLNEITTTNGKVTINRLTNRPIRALCAMHTLGHPVDMDPLLELCNKYHLALIEDAAEAIGSYYKGKHVGHSGLLSTLSFNGNKVITTGGGGAILTNDRELARRAKHLTTTAKLPHPWLFEHDQIGYNYRLPNINAALGCAQLEQIGARLQAKRLLFEKYKAICARLNDIEIVEEPDYAKSNYWLIALRLDEDSAEARDAILEQINASGVMVRPLWNLQHTLSMFAKCPKMPLQTATELASRIITIPSSPQLIREDIMQPTAMGML